MPRVNYIAPTTVDDAVKALAGASGLAKVLSGGTDLLVQMKSGRLKPEQFISHRMPLSEGAHAYELFNDRRDGALKMVLTV